VVRGGKKNERTQSIILACLLWPFLLSFSKCPEWTLEFAFACASARALSHVSIECMSEVFCSRSHITSHLIHPNPKASVSISLRHSFFFRFFSARSAHSESQMGAGPFVLSISLARSIINRTRLGGRAAPTRGRAYTLPPPPTPPHLQSTPSSFARTLARIRSKKHREIKSTHITYVRKMGGRV
jgi:hypothetical protein